MKRALCVGMVLLQAIASWAAEKDVEIPTTTEPVTGAWIGTFSVATNFAFSNDIPLVMVWSMANCGHCNDLKRGFLKPDFKAWQSSREFVFCLVEGDANGNDQGVNRNSGAKKFTKTANGTCREARSGTPYVSLLWYDGGQLVTNACFRGRMGEFPGVGSGTEIWQQFMNCVDAHFHDYSEESAFDCGDTVGDRLEAEAWTTSVNVPLIRKGLAATKDARETLAVLLPNGTEAERKAVTWSAGQANQFVAVETAPRYALGKALTLVLFNGKGKEVARRPIAFVERENSPKNPTWKGVSKCGEWTMDLVAAQGLPGRAHTLALVGGSMWCPDCAKTDAYFVDTPEFKAWALEKKVACVAVDIPNWSATAPTTGPCLLTREAKEVSESYIAADPEQGAKQSGTGYLSRWEISDEAALKKLEDNRKLAGTSTLNGGWNRPERSNQYRTGVPIFVLLNDDGSIAGRFEDFASTSPTNTNSVPAYIDRMNDLLETAGGREDCLSWMTATTVDCQLPVSGGKVNSTVSAVRRTNWWKLTGVCSWLRGTFVLKGDRESGTPGESNVSLSVWKKEGATATKVATTEGNLFNGVTLTGIAIDGQSEWFVQVEAKGTSAAFGVLHTGDSSVGYTLSVTAVDDPGSVAFTSSGTTVKEADVKKAGGVKEVRAILVRTGGAAGVKTVDIEIDPSSTAEDERYDLVDGSVTWVDGESGEKAVRIWVYDDPNADGTQDVVLNAEGSRYTLTIIDDDKMKIGQISLSDAEPSIAKSRTVIAVEGSVVGIGVSRIDGASGTVSARLVADAGRFRDESRIEWANRKSGLVWRELVLPSLAEAPKSGKVTVKLDSPEGAKVDTRTKALTIQLIAADAPKFAEEKISLTLAERYVSMRRTVGILNVAADAKKVSVKKLSGTQPSGLKVSVVNGQFVLEGIPTCKAGTYAAVYQVSETVGRKTVQGLTLEVEFTVGDFTALPAEDPGANPSVAKARTIPDAIVMNARSGEIVGMVTGLSINQRGKLSAKYKCKAGTISLSSAGWSSYDPNNGTLEVTLTAKKTGHELKVRALRDGDVQASVYDPDLPDGGLDLIVPEMWDGKVNSAEPWKGYYTVDFTPTNGWAGVSALAAKGDAIATLKMTSSSDVKKGRMKYSGVLPNGKGFSGSAVLVKTGVDTVVAPLFFLSSTDFFVATPQIAVGQPEHAVSDWPQGGAFWTHTEAKSEEGSYECAYRTAGSFYDSKSDLEMLAMTRGSTIRLFCAKPALESEIPVVIQPNKPVVADPAAAKAYKLSLRFTKSTGLINGTFKFTDAVGAVKTATYKGVVMPDWDGCPTCDDRPWAAGAFWYSDKLWYEDAQGHSRSVSVKCGDQIIIELAQ